MKLVSSIISTFIGFAILLSGNQPCHASELKQTEIGNQKNWHGKLIFKDHTEPVEATFEDTKNGVDGVISCKGVNGTVKHFVRGKYLADTGEFSLQELGIDTDNDNSTDFHPAQFNSYALHLVDQRRKLVGTITLPDQTASLALQPDNLVTPPKDETIASAQKTQASEKTHPIDTGTPVKEPAPKLQENESEVNSKEPEEQSATNPMQKRSWVKRTATFWKLKYYFVAQNEADCEFFYGLIQDNPLIGRASVDFIGPNKCNCHGVAQVTSYPLDGGTNGQRGYIKVKCSDGRTMSGKFTTQSLTTGTASVADSLGHIYKGTFGHTAEQAIAETNKLRRQLGCDELSAKHIETEVQGQILKK